MKIINSYCIENNPKMPASSFKGLPANIPVKPVYLPEKFGEIGKWAGEYAGVPEQKILLAASAFLLQPLIDLKYAQEDKKAETAVKSASKALAGGITGFTIRALLLKILNKKIYINFNGDTSVNLTSRFFMPKDALKMFQYSPERAKVRLAKYRSVLSNIAAILIMALVTNEKLDVPLTCDFQDLFNGIAKDNKTWGQSIRDVAKARYEKIAMFIDRKLDYVRSARDKSKRIFRIIREKNAAKYRKKALDERS